MINMNTKNECEVCGGKYTYRNKAVHKKTQRHIKAVGAAPVVVVPKEQIYFNDMNDEQKAEMLKLLTAEVVDVGEEKEFEEYLIIREGGVWSPEQLEIYLKHHTKDGELLTDEEKQFVRDMA